MSRYIHAVRALPRLVKHRVDGNEAELEREIFDTFSKMGGIYVKFLQVLVSNTKMLQTLSASERMSVFDRSKPSPIDHHEILRSELGAHGQQWIASVENEPFATGSFANVYRARLKDGNDVIIKIKRPGLKQQLRFDFVIIRSLVSFLAAVQSNRKMDIASVAKQYADGVMREIDYKSEIENALSFYETYKEHPDIFIPFTYPQLSNKEVIVQQRVQGVALSEVMNRADPQAAAMQAVGSNLKHQLHVLGLDILERSFAGKFIHGDPHPGNIFLLSNNKIAMIDFGLVAEPADDALGYLEYMKEQLFINRGELRPGKFALSMLRTSSKKLYHALHMVDMQLANNQIMKAIERAGDARFYRRAGDPKAVIARMQHGYTTEIFDAVVNPDNQLSFATDIDGLVMRRANHTVWSTIISLGWYKEIIPPMYEEAVARGIQNGQVKPFKGAPKNIEDALETVADWLSSVRESDPIFFMEVANYVPSSLSQRS